MTEKATSAGAKPRYRAETRAYMMPTGRWQPDLAAYTVAEARHIADRLAEMGHITRVFDTLTRRAVPREA